MTRAIWKIKGENGNRLSALPNLSSSPKWLNLKKSVHLGELKWFGGAPKCSPFSSLWKIDKLSTNRIMESSLMKEQQVKVLHQLLYSKL
jgi:hypothetical protein